MVQLCVWKVPVGGSFPPEQDTNHKIVVYAVCSVLFRYINVPKHDGCQPILDLGILDLGSLVL